MILLAINKQAAFVVADHLVQAREQLSTVHHIVSLPAVQVHTPDTETAIENLVYTVNLPQSTILTGFLCCKQVSKKELLAVQTSKVTLNRLLARVRRLTEVCYLAEHELFTSHRHKCKFMFGLYTHTVYVYMMKIDRFIGRCISRSTLMCQP